MRSLLLSIGTCILILDAAWAQNSGVGANTPQLPVGQTFKNFEFPIYQNGILSYKFIAATATGTTLNRAAVTDLKIEVYDHGAVTATITSPNADLYVAEQKMRTKDTVKVEDADRVATAQTCDFDMTTKKYLLRTNVKVILKHFDLTMSPTPGGNAPTSAPTNTPSSLTIPMPPSSPETK